MTANHKEAGLKIAHTNHAAALAALAKVQALFPLAGANMPAPDANKIEKARLGLEDCLAGRRLDEATAEDEEKARAALAFAQKTFDAEKTAFAAAGLEHVGLNRRLVAAQQLEAEAKRTRDDLEVEWILEEMRIADEAYTRQAEETFRSYLRVTACADALRKRNAKPQHHFSLSSEMALPTIGPASCAAWLVARPRNDHAFGKMLFTGSRIDRFQAKDASVERDLEALTSSKTASGLARFAKAVTGLIPGAEK